MLTRLFELLVATGHGESKNTRLPPTFPAISLGFQKDVRVSAMIDPWGLRQPFREWRQIVAIDTT
jgi:hypothetical protein